MKTIRRIYYSSLETDDEKFSAFRGRQSDTPEGSTKGSRGRTHLHPAKVLVVLSTFLSLSLSLCKTSLRNRKQTNENEKSNRKQKVPFGDLIRSSFTLSVCIHFSDWCLVILLTDWLTVLGYYLKSSILSGESSSCSSSLSSSSSFVYFEIVCPRVFLFVRDSRPLREILPLSP